MDNGAIAGWLAALIALLAWLTEYWHRGRETRVKTLNTRLKPIEDALTQSDANHRKHFTAASAMATSLARVEQRIEDHETTCSQRMGEIQAMFKEIRGYLMNGDSK